MSGLNAIMDNSLSALLASQAGLATSGHNIANAHTPGFNRQDVIFGARRPEVTAYGAIGRGVEIMGIMFDEHDMLYGTAFLSEPDPNPYESPLFTIDTTTGFASVVGQTGFRLPHGGDYLVPEPSSATLLSLGTLALLLLRKRQRTR